MADVKRYKYVFATFTFLMMIKVE